MTALTELVDALRLGWLMNGGRWEWMTIAGVVVLVGIVLGRVLAEPRDWGR